MKTIELVGQIDEHHRLSAQVPADVPPGRVKVAITVRTESDGDDESGLEWTAGVAREWAEELTDARQDIYTLVDGEPVDGSR